MKGWETIFCWFIAFKKFSTVDGSPNWYSNIVSNEWSDPLLSTSWIHMRGCEGTTNYTDKKDLNLIMMLVKVEIEWVKSRWFVRWMKWGGDRQDWGSAFTSHHVMNMSQEIGQLVTWRFRSANFLEIWIFSWPTNLSFLWPKYFLSFLFLLLDKICL